MVLGPTARRRWFGAIVLLVALAMLVGGETVLKGKLKDLGFVAYWLACVGLTGLAVLIALLDARLLQRQTRQEQRQLFENTLRKIQTDAHGRPRSPAGKQKKP